MARAEFREPETPLTREEFLAWAEQQPTGRFERIDGIVVARAPERASHNLDPPGISVTVEAFYTD